MTGGIYAGGTAGRGWAWLDRHGHRVRYSGLTDESAGRPRRRDLPPPRKVRTPQGRVVVNGNPG